MLEVINEESPKTTEFNKKIRISCTPFLDTTNEKKIDVWKKEKEWFSEKIIPLADSFDTDMTITDNIKIPLGTTVLEQPKNPVPIVSLTVGKNKITIPVDNCRTDDVIMQDFGYVLSCSLCKKINLLSVKFLFTTPIVSLSNIPKVYLFDPYIFDESKKDTHQNFTIQVKNAESLYAFVVLIKAICN